MKRESPIQLTVDLEPALEEVELRLLEAIWTLERSLEDQRELLQRILLRLEENPTTHRIK